MNVDSREVLSQEASNLLRRGAMFDEIGGLSSEVAALTALGLLKPRDSDKPDEGYVITPLGSDVVHGVGPFKLTPDDGSHGMDIAPVS